jgi:uncharacterized protein YlxW (UPF0749 family)
LLKNEISDLTIQNNQINEKYNLLNEKVSKIEEFIIKYNKSNNTDIWGVK